MKLKALLALAVASVALAQGPGPRGFGGMGGQAGRMAGAMGQASQHTFTELKAYLGLTDAQITQIQNARQTVSTSMQALMTQIHDKNTALHALLDNGTTDAAAAGTLLLAINGLQKQVQQLRTTEQTAALNLLTADQKTKLTALDAASKLQPAIQQAMGLGLLTPTNPAGGPGGPGGFGGPGMRPSGMRGPRQ